MKNVLIPTDFTISSLRLISASIAHFEGQQLEIHLIHALEPDDSISGLLFMNKRLKAHSLYDDTFLQACEMLKNKYASVITKINVAFYMGSSQSYKNNFLDARKIDTVILPVNYVFKNCSPEQSVQPSGLWKNISVPIIHITLPEHKPALQSMENSMAALLHS